MRVVTFLAQFAIVQPNNLLTIVNVPIDSQVVGLPHSLVVLVYVDWLETNVRHLLRLALFDGQGEPVLSTIDQHPIHVEMPVEVGRPAGVPRGMTFKIPLALNLTGLNLPAGMYEWRATVGQEQHADWNTVFMLVPPPTPGGQVSS